MRIPSQLYSDLVNSGKIISNESQTSALKILDNLHRQLTQHKPKSVGLGNFLPKYFQRKEFTKGLYMYGDVGTGKTFLMDLFYQSLADQSKQRHHFHRFMLSVHRKFHTIREKKRKINHKIRQQNSNSKDISEIASEIAESGRILCFDEFQVTDIADAMILRQLFSKIQDRGVTMVLTSNRHPDELYKNGIQRKSFLPCIDLIKESNTIYSLDSGNDFRELGKSFGKSFGSFLHPNSPETGEKLDQLYANICHGEASTEASWETTMGRLLNVKKQNERYKVARFEFDDLCSSNLGSNDYLTLPQHYQTIFIENIPKMNLLMDRDKVRRFITLLDVIYDSEITLICSAETEPDLLFDTNDSYAGHDEVFALNRAISRLKGLY